MIGKISCMIEVCISRRSRFGQSEWRVVNGAGLDLPTLSNCLKKVGKVRSVPQRLFSLVFRKSCGYDSAVRSQIVSIVALFGIGCGSVGAGPQMLSVEFQGEGGGSVVSEPGGIDCNLSGCEAEFPPFSRVTLVAQPDEDSIFSGWSDGGCLEITNDQKCIVEMSEALHVSAIFEAAHVLFIHPAGNGFVTAQSDDVAKECTQTCSERYRDNTQVKLMAVPSGANSFVGWTGACQDFDSDPVCSVTLDKAKQVDALFSGVRTFVTGTSESVWGLPEQIDFSTGTSGVDDPTVRFDELEICFDLASNIACASRDSRSSPWREAREIDTLNSHCNETTPTFSSDGLMLVLASRRTTGPECQDYWDLYAATRRSVRDKWDPPKKLNINSATNDFSPVISPDSNQIIFSSGRGADKEDHLYISRRPDISSSLWSEPQRLEGSIKSAFATHWGIKGTLILSSSHLKGGLNRDIFFADIVENSIKNVETILGFGSSEREEDGWLSRDLRTLYYSRDVEGRSVILHAKHR